MIIGLILIAIGVAALLVKLGLVTGSVWSLTWPILLIILGLAWFLRGTFPRRRRFGWGPWWCCWGPEEKEEHH